MAGEADFAEETTAQSDTKSPGPTPSESAAGGVTRRRRLAGPVAATGLAVALGALVCAALLGIGGWLGYQVLEGKRAAEREQEYVQAARQGAVNLTTIDFQHAEADVQRIIDASTGTFRDEFESRSNAFVETVKAAKSTSEGTISEAGLLNHSDNHAEVLVSVAVKTIVNGVADGELRHWRMRIGVTRDGDAIKVSDVQFVS